MAGNVYRIAQANLGIGFYDFDDPNGASQIIKCVGVKDASFVFDESDADLAAVLVNGGAAITVSGQAAVEVDATTAMIVTGVATGTGGADYDATKTTFDTVAAENAWVAVIVYDATIDTNNSTRIPISAHPLSITPNGASIEVHWGGTDGVGTWMTSRNAA